MNRSTVFFLALALLACLGVALWGGYALVRVDQEPLAESASEPTAVRSTPKETPPPVAAQDLSPQENDEGGAAVEVDPTSLATENKIEGTSPLSADRGLSPQRSDAGGVVVVVEPPNLDAENNTWEFSVALNTHSVALDQDMAQVSILRDDRGEEHSALAWEGAPPGGHHRQGLLRFAALSEPAQSFEIVIRDVASVPERVFRWEGEPGSPAS